MDFQGHGRSGGARGDIGSLEAAVNDATELVTTVCARSTTRLPIALFGHSLGSMITFLAAHKLSTDEALRTPDMVVLSGFAMDSVSPPFGLQLLTPVLRSVPSVVRAVTAVLARLQPQGPACPLPAAHELTRCPEQAAAVQHDPLHHHGWIQNRTALALLDGRARCQQLLPVWGCGFPFLLVHGGEDELCPRSACEALMAASPQCDKELKVFPGLLHEVLFERRDMRERVQAHILDWLEPRLRVAAASQHDAQPLRSKL